MGEAPEVFQVKLNEGPQVLDSSPSPLEKELSEKRLLALS